MGKNRSSFQKPVKKESTVDNTQNTDQKNDIVTPVDGDAQPSADTIVLNVTADQAAGLLQPMDEGAEKDSAGEEQPVEEPAPAAAPQEPVVIPAGRVLPPATLDDVDQLPLSCSPSSRLVIEELKHYIEKMSARVRMPVEEGGQMQMNLYHTLVQAINSKAEDFDAVFGLTMKLIRDNLKGAFSDENMHRYTPHVTMPSQRVAHFRHLLSTLTALADPASRQIALRQVNLAQTFHRAPIREDARQRVLNYFNV
jgi:hypothetical protein